MHYCAGACGIPGATAVACPPRDEYQKRSSYEFLAQYRYYIAFENRLCGNYTTEKVLKAVLTNTVPILFSERDFADELRFIAPNTIFIEPLLHRNINTTDYIRRLLAETDEHFQQRQFNRTQFERLFHQVPNNWQKICDLVQNPNFNYHMHTKQRRAQFNVR